MQFRFLAIFILLASHFFAFCSHANLLIYPVRVTFDDKDRTAQLTLTNTSKVPTIYRLGWRENQALADGNYKLLSKEQAVGLPIASPMLRYSPRQVKLAPGERQTVKLMLRKPRDLADGEYRSHLRFKALPQQSNAHKDSNNTATTINLVMNFSVPVTVQQGSLDVKVELTNAAIAYAKNSGQAKVALSIKRQGLHSAAGNITAYWTPKNGKQLTLAKLSDYNLWAELTEATTELVWTGTAFAPQDGSLRVVYEGVREFKGITYFDQKFEIKQQDIKALP